MSKQLSSSVQNKKNTWKNTPSGVSCIVEETTNNIVNKLSTAVDNIFKNYNQALAKTMVQKNSEHIEKVKKKIRDNIECIHKAGFDIEEEGLDKNRLLRLATADHTQNAIKIIEALDIPKNMTFLGRTEFMFTLATSKWNKETSLFFHDDLLNECIDHFWKEELQAIFTYDGIEISNPSNRIDKHPISGKSIANRVEEWEKIIAFCMHTGFDSGMWSISNFLKIGDFLSPINEDDEEYKTVNYLWSYASELRYIIEKFGIPFDTLFALPKKDIALYCWVLRSLHNSTWIKHWHHTKTVEFVVWNKASELKIKDVLDINTMIFYAENHSVPKLKKFIDFLQWSSTKKTKIPDLKLLTDPEIQSARRNYLYLKRTLGSVSFIKNFDRNNYVDDTSKIPVFLNNNNIAPIVLNYIHLKNILWNPKSISEINREECLLDTKKIPTYLKDKKIISALENLATIKDLKWNISCIKNIDIDQCLNDNSKIPSFLMDPRTKANIDRLQTLYMIIWRWSGIYNGEDVAMFKTNRWSYIQDPNKIPDFISDEKKHNDLKKELSTYTNILQYVANKKKFIIPDWDIYFNNPNKLKPLIKKMQEDAQSITRNMDTVLTLAKTLSLQPSPFFIGKDEKSTSPHKQSTQYIKYLNQLEHKYAWLYSIGGKIHTENSIDNEKVEKFSREFWFWSSPFKLIHANTSVLLPPSYFPEELQFMITAMGQYGLFENHEKPQLQISIPWRLQEEAKAAILASSMILSSKTHVEYSLESFSTTHNSSTGRRMVSYDAWVYDPLFKYNSESIKGRTDVLLLRDINLIPKAKIIGSLLSQTEYDGRFAQLGMEFIRDYMDLMAKYWLSSMITDKPRIFNGEWNGETIDIVDHHTAVKSFTDRQAMDYFIYNNTNQSEGLLVFELEKLLQIYRKKIQSIQSRFR